MLWNRALAVMSGVVIAVGQFFSSAYATDRYVTEFEPPVFGPGNLAADNYWDGQDSWVYTTDANHQANQNGIQVQGRITRGGEQAVEFSAPSQDIEYGHLRKNVIFTMPDERFLVIDMDMFLTSSPNPSEAWGLDIQNHLITRLAKWLVFADDTIRSLTVDGLWIPAPFVFTRNTWHSSRTIIDMTSNTVDLYMDGQWLSTSDVIYPLPEHVYTSIFLSMPGDDTLYFDNFSIASQTVLGVDEHPGMPADFELAQNYPNPFNGSTSISFTLNGPVAANLSVYDITGALVSILHDGYMEAGRHALVWDEPGLASGVYFYRLTTPAGSAARKMQLIK